MEDGGFVCQNCAQAIATSVTIQRNEDNETFIVGTDCAKTLAGVDKLTVKKIENIVRTDSKKLREFKGGNYFFIESEKSVAVLRYCTKNFHGEPYFAITPQCYISKAVFGDNNYTTKEEIEKIAPELLQTSGYKYYVLNESIL